MTNSYFGATDTGRLRDNNEDAFIAREVGEGRYIAACVIDGVGGYDGGEIAAAVARDTINEVLSYPFEDAVKTLRSAMLFANERIFEEKEKNPEKSRMSCVLTAALVDMANNHFYYIHLGDTRLYLIRDSTLVKVTKDHSFVGFLEDSGRLTEEAAMRHPKRNEINKALGFDPEFHQKEDAFESGDSPFLPGDMLLLCSDGLTDMINREQIIGIAAGRGSIEEKVSRLIAAANEAGGRDNITVVLVQHRKEKKNHEATMPARPQETRMAGDGLSKPEPLPDLRQKRKRSRAFLIILAAILLLLLAAIWLLGNYGPWVGRGTGRQGTFRELKKPAMPDHIGLLPYQQQATGTAQITHS